MNAELSLRRVYHSQGFMHYWHAVWYMITITDNKKHADSDTRTRTLPF